MNLAELQGREDDFIEAHLGLAVQVGRSLSTHCPWLTEDYVSEALLALTVIVRRLAQNPDACDIEHPVAYLKSSIVRHVMRSQSRVDPAVSLDREVEYTSETGLTDILSDALSCCRNPKEREVVLLRSEGLTDSDVACVMNLSSSNVLRTRKQIRERYELAC